MEVHYLPETVAELRRILYGYRSLMKVQLKDRVGPPRSSRCALLLGLRSLQRRAGGVISVPP
jgi:hypothetical protein